MAKRLPELTPLSRSAASFQTPLLFFAPSEGSAAKPWSLNTNSPNKKTWQDRTITKKFAEKQSFSPPLDFYPS
jgi:hypothetical protein